MERTNYLDHIKKEYSKSIKNPEDLKYILNNAKDIVQKTLDVNGEPNNSTGILIGKIQSGKTANFLAVAAEALDGVYDIVVVIGGKDTILFDQNYDRIKKTFPATKKLSIIKIDKLKDQENYMASLLKRNYKSILACMKNTDWFDNLNNVLENIKNKLDRNINILFIDDEGDQGTLNGNENTKRDYLTKWNQQITRIRELQNKYSYITVTATPYVNLLINLNEVFSPSFIKTSMPGSGYMGLDYFHNEFDSNEVIKLIDFDAEQKILGPDFDISIAIPNSLKEAISHYILSSSLMQLESESDDVKTNMLVHIFRKIDDHAIIKESIENYINGMNKKAAAPKTDFKYKEFLNFIELGYEVLYNKKFDKNLDNYDEIIENFKECLELVTVNEVNRTSKKKGSNNNVNESISNFTILIGADLLERGVTIDNLVTTYFIRTPKGRNNADTLHQRARWFGYRKNIIKYMRVFIGESSYNDFKQIREIDNNLWDQLYELELNQLNVEEFMKNPILKYNVDGATPSNKAKGLNITRKNAARVVESNLTFGLVYQKIKMENSNNEIEYFNNIKINKVFKTHTFAETRDYKYNDFKNFSDFFNTSKIAGKDFFNTSKIAGKDFFEKLKFNTSLFDINEINNIPVRVFYIYGESKPLERSVNIKNNTFTMFVGQESNVNFYDESTWFGERYLNRYKFNSDKIIIQIHEFKFKTGVENSNDKNCVYSMYLPVNKANITGFTRDITNIDNKK